MLLRVLAVLALIPGLGFAQVDYQVYTEHPRLWLEAARLQRLRKEVERKSERWMSLRSLIDHQITLPEEPLVRALEFQVTENETAGRAAIDWALAKVDGGGLQDPADLRLAAVVFDWCFALLGDEQRDRLASAIAAAVESLAVPSHLNVSGFRSAVLAAIAAADHWNGSAPALGDLLERRWKTEILPALLAGELPDQPTDLVALLEMFHVTRHNLELDLWQQALPVFKPLPLVLMLGYYPAPLQTPAGLFRQPARATAAKANREINAELSRIAEMLLVAYEQTLQEYQLLQGWLRHDSYTLKTAFGAPYEFLWLNPYLPGLSYFSAPLVVHDKFRGRLFARAGWQEDDLWLGYLDGQMQIFAEGQRTVITPEMKQAPLIFLGAAVVPARVPMRFRVKVPDGNAIYLIGLEQDRTYRVKTNRSPFRVYQAGRGGILALENRFEHGKPLLDFGSTIRVEIRAAPQGSPTLRREKD